MDSNLMIEMIAEIIYDERERDNNISWKQAKQVAILIVEKLEEKECLK